MIFSSTGAIPLERARIFGNCNWPSFTFMGKNTSRITAMHSQTSVLKVAKTITLMNVLPE